jgi:hypothetical protein
MTGVRLTADSKHDAGRDIVADFDTTASHIVANWFRALADYCEGVYRFRASNPILADDCAKRSF